MNENCTLNVSPPTCLDLFCGCGGFTLGMQRAGLHVLAAIDFNAEAIATLRANLVEKKRSRLIPVTHALQCDLTVYNPEELSKVIGTSQVDVIVGGPPCQGFSTARQVDGANHGKRLKHDARRHLYKDLLRFVEFFQPKLFVMENVLGIRSAAGGEYFTRVHKEARELGRAGGKPGYRVHGQTEYAYELGVPQKRRRQLIIGVRNDLPGFFPSKLLPAPRATPNTNLGIAIGDLPPLAAGTGADECEYDGPRRAQHMHEGGTAATAYLFKVLEVGGVPMLINHVARPHSERDLGDFVRLREGESSAAAMRKRGVVFDFPYDKSSFKDRYTRQSRYQPCSTIVAHLSKDGLMFIHPTQNRSLTPREAARVQSFPDWFRFPISRTHSFRMIGNAVPPLIGEAVGLATKVFLLRANASNVPAFPRRTQVRNQANVHQDAGQSNRNSYILSSYADATHELERLAQLDRRALRTVPTRDFLRGWHALLFLFPGLHPDNALDHGPSIESAPENQLVLPAFEELLSRRYSRSGWPVALDLIGREAWRRYEAMEIGEDDLYCEQAQRAGMMHYAGDPKVDALGRCTR